MSARVSGGTYHGGTEVIVECPARESSECGMRWEECGAELECEQSAGGLWTIPKECPSCDRLIQFSLRERVIQLAEEAIDNYEPPEPDMNAVSNAERQELAARDFGRLKR